MEWYGMIMESTWSIPYGFHDHSIPYSMDSIPYSMASMDSRWNGVLIPQLEVM